MTKSKKNPEDDSIKNESLAIKLPPREQWEMYTITKIIKAPSAMLAMSAEHKAKVVSCEMIRTAQTDASLPDAISEDFISPDICFLEEDKVGFKTHEKQVVRTNTGRRKKD